MIGQPRSGLRLATSPTEASRKSQMLFQTPLHQSQRICIKERYLYTKSTTTCLSQFQSHRCVKFMKRKRKYKIKSNIQRTAVGPATKNRMREVSGMTLLRGIMAAAFLVTLLSGMSSGEDKPMQDDSRRHLCHINIQHNDRSFIDANFFSLNDLGTAVILM